MGLEKQKTEGWPGQEAERAHGGGRRVPLCQRQHGKREGPQLVNRRQAECAGSRRDHTPHTGQSQGVNPDPTAGASRQGQPRVSASHTVGDEVLLHSERPSRRRGHDPAVLGVPGGPWPGVTLRCGKKSQSHISEKEPQEARWRCSARQAGALLGDPLQAEKGPQPSSTTRLGHKVPLLCPFQSCS